MNNMHQPKPTYKKVNINDDFQLKSIVKQYMDQANKSDDKQKIVRWNNGLIELWQYKLLRDYGAINEIGILSDYLMLLIETDNGDQKYVDRGSNLSELRQAESEVFSKFSNKSIRTRIEGTPRIYIRFKKTINRILNSENEITPPYQEKLMSNEDNSRPITQGATAVANQASINRYYDHQ